MQIYPVSLTIDAMSKQVVRWVESGVLAIYAIGVFAGGAYADTLQSPNYKFDESSIGAGGLGQSSSANYQARDALGDTAVGNSASTNYQIDAGSKTTNDPALSFAIISASANFGSFSATTASVATTTFAVSNYTSYGYVVQLLGNPPSNGSHTIAAMASTGGSVPGTEQFGVNLVANTLPSAIGANPSYGLFGVGSASANYGTANAYRYVSGETIVSAPKSSGMATYTISYMVNVGGLTPGGQYSGGQVAICTGTY